MQPVARIPKRKATIGPRSQIDKSLFASFSSEKEDLPTLTSYDERQHAQEQAQRPQPS
jgi:hypothetical protein